MKKVIICFGDSWTSGHFLDPTVKYVHLLHNNNKEYCISKSWVRHLENETQIKTINLGEPACSNDRIVYRIDNELDSILKRYNPEDILCLVGWSSPERRDFNIKFKKFNEKITLLPAEGIDTGQKERFKARFGGFDGDQISNFYNNYFYYFWCFEEYIPRHRNNVVLTDSILTNLNIDVIYFDAFYETSGFVNKETKQEHYQLATFGQVGKLYSRIFKDKFIPYTFREYLEDMNDKTLFEEDDHHPTELGHKLWAKHLMQVLNDRKKI